tara:strand:- start:941 stop:1180 length:240 start_codon:yes stop_codon:yes gene_type:complete
MVITMLYTVVDGDAVLQGEKLNVTLTEKSTALVQDGLGNKLVSAGLAVTGRRMYFQHEENSQTIDTYIDEDGWSDVPTV